MTTRQSFSIRTPRDAAARITLYWGGESPPSAGGGGGGSSPPEAAEGRTPSPEAAEPQARPPNLLIHLFILPPPCPRPPPRSPARSLAPPPAPRPAPAPSARERASDRAGDRLCVTRPARFYASDPISRGEFTRSDPFLRGPTRFIRGPIRVVDFTRRPDFTRVADPISRGPIRVYASDPILTRPTHGPTRFHASEATRFHASDSISRGPTRQNDVARG